ncbi:hypothetical protein PAPYR_1607 [Paratrimastix pyriformis]|uniref:Uncharacterized protein n=1 Tax=Paratrimastix pyriformis TaxID=342808 RepID=A0ABQ8US13_9EUKA|nr:hypothetical protein PAPYR_1607 [Paratrimastix pyriformis]
MSGQLFVLFPSLVAPSRRSCGYPGWGQLAIPNGLIQQTETIFTRAPCATTLTARNPRSRASASHIPTGHLVLARGQVPSPPAFDRQAVGAALRPLLQELARQVVLPSARLLCIAQATNKATPAPCGPHEWVSVETGRDFTERLPGKWLHPAAFGDASDLQLTIPRRPLFHLVVGSHSPGRRLFTLALETPGDVGSPGPGPPAVSSFPRAWTCTDVHGRAWSGMVGHGRARMGTGMSAMGTDGHGRAYQTARIHTCRAQPSSVNCNFWGDVPLSHI